MAVQYHAVVIRKADGNDGDTTEYEVVAMVDNSGQYNPNFVDLLTTSYVSAEAVATAMNGGS